MYRNLLFSFGVAMILLSSCRSDSQDGKPKLSVSIEPQRQILECLVGDHYDVLTVLASGANPETYEPSVAQRMATNDSKAYFMVGYLPFEDVVASGLGQDTRVVNTSAGIDILSGTHSHGNGEEHDEADPHVWTSVRNSVQIASNMLNALVEIDPDHAEEYKANFQRLSARLDSLDTVLADRIATSGVHAFMVWHPSLSYYARDYGLHQLSVGQESKELSMSNMRSIIDEAREDSVQVFFFQREYDTRQAQSLNKEIGSRLVTIDPLAYDWEAELIRITDELTR